MKLSEIDLTLYSIVFTFPFSKAGNILPSKVKIDALMSILMGFVAVSIIWHVFNF